MSLCKTPLTTREILGPLSFAELKSLAQMPRYSTVSSSSPDKDSNPPPSLSSMKVLVRLEKYSQGFPFLAEELLLQAATDFHTSILGADTNIPPALQTEASSQQDVLQTLDKYTPEELTLLDEFYKLFKRDAGWESVSTDNGVEYLTKVGIVSSGLPSHAHRLTPLSQPNLTGSLRQGRGVGMIPNATPHQLLRDVNQMTRSLDHYTHKGGTSGAREVLEEPNDHSAIVRVEIPFPSPLHDREVREPRTLAA